MTWTWIHNDISANDVFGGDLPKPLGAIAARTLLMPCATDLYFRTADNAAELAHVKNGGLVEIPSYWDTCPAPAKTRRTRCSSMRIFENFWQSPCQAE